MDQFVKRQNIAHYRGLLESGSLDETQRKTILALLAREERRQSQDQGASSESDKPNRSAD